MINKEEYLKLREEIGKQIGLTESQVNWLRSWILGENLTIEEVLDKTIEWSKKSHEYQNHHKNRRSHSRKYYQEIIAWIGKNSEKPELIKILLKEL